MNPRTSQSARPLPAALFVLLLLIAADLIGLAPALRASADDRFRDLPGYDVYVALTRLQGRAAREARLQDVRWHEDGSAVDVQYAAAWRRVQLATNEIGVIDADAVVEAPDAAEPDRETRRTRRGEQRRTERSPDGQWIARSVEWNVVIEPSEIMDDREPIVVTEDGERKRRYGRASWVYGEELRQTEAMWWSPDSSRLAYYEFDEREVPDYYLTDGLTELRTEVLVEGYPKAGDPNPVARLWVFDIATGTQTRIDTGDPDGTGHYVYRVRFSPDGRHLLYQRTNRHQNVLELVAACVKTGEARNILTESQPDAWQDNLPIFEFVSDRESESRFLWGSEATGWKHLHLWCLDAGHLATLSEGEWPVREIVKIDTQHERVYFIAHCDTVHINEHLRVASFDGGGSRRLTPAGRSFANFDIAPCGLWFIAREESIDRRPRAILFSSNGKEMRTLAESDATSLEVRGLELPELMTVKAADGETPLYGVVYKPPNFDPEKAYPLLLDVYGGPYFQRVRNRYQPINPGVAFDYIIVRIDNRGTPHRGKAFESATYLRLGTVDLDDQVAAVLALRERPYVDPDRIGIMGHSYGGYLAALAMLRYPEIFHAAVAGAAVTDWRNYDTIYTERYMRTPDENPEGYDAGSCVKLAGNLEGSLLIMHGMMDDNVHPANAWQLIDELQRASRPFEMMMFPRAGHGLGRGGAARRWLFLHHELRERSPVAY